MPELIFTGLIPFHYPVTRDARGVLLGDVEPDDIRDLDEAPDLMWREPTEEDRARIAAKSAAAQDEPGDEDSGEADESDDSPPAATTPPQPVPAPPAIIPPAPAIA